MARVPPSDVADSDTDPPLKIRPATLDDADAMARVHVEAWRAGYAGLMPADFLASLDVVERAAEWRERLANPAADVSYLVATRHAVVGFCAFGGTRDEDLPTASCAEVYALNVESASWSEGVGGALLLGSLRALSAYDDVVLWVLEQNSRARRFYERHGFQLDGAQKSIAIGGVHLPELRYRRGPPRA